MPRKLREYAWLFASTFAGLLFLSFAEGIYNAFESIFSGTFAFSPQNDAALVATASILALLGYVVLWFGSRRRKKRMINKLKKAISDVAPQYEDIWAELKPKVILRQVSLIDVDPLSEYRIRLEKRMRAVAFDWFGYEHEHLHFQAEKKEGDEKSLDLVDISKVDSAFGSIFFITQYAEELVEMLAETFLKARPKHKWEHLKDSFLEQSIEGKVKAIIERGDWTQEKLKLALRELNKL